MTAAVVRNSAGALGHSRERFWWMAPLAALSLHGVLLAWLAGPDRAAPPPSPVLRVQWLPPVAPPLTALLSVPKAVPTEPTAPMQAARSNPPRQRQRAFAAPASSIRPSETGPYKAQEPLAATAFVSVAEASAAPVVLAPSVVAPSPQQPEPSSTPARFDAAYLANPEPPYPPAARMRGEVGTVRLRVRVGADGRPEAVEVSQSSGYAQLDRAAENTVRQHWRFAPAQRGGSPVADTVIVPIAFRLH